MSAHNASIESQSQHRLRTIFAATPFLLLVGCQDGLDHSIPPPGPLEDASKGTACVASPIFLLIKDDTGIKLATFDPQAATFNLLGTPMNSPVGNYYGSIAVDHAGQVYVSDSLACGLQKIYRIDPATLTVSSTPAAQSRNFQPSMGVPCIVSTAFVADPSSPSGETLYVHSWYTQGDAAGKRLGFVNPTTSAISDIATLGGSAASRTENSVVLTGTSKGELFAALNAHENFAIGTEIDPVDLKTGVATFRWQLNEIPANDDASPFHLFARWGGDFYFFVSLRSRQQVNVIRFSLSNFSTTKIATTTAFRALAVASSQCTS